MRDYKQFYINGEWVDPATPNDFDVINPANEEVCAQISLGSEADVDKAVAAAKAAFESFGRTSRQERVELLESCIEVYQKYYNDIADAIREEMGAPQELAAGAQAFCGLGHLQEAAKILKDFQFEEDLGEHRVFKEPIGVCGLITPWNWPAGRCVQYDQWRRAGGGYRTVQAPRREYDVLYGLNPRWIPGSPERRAYSQARHPGIGRQVSQYHTG
jgi:aldehyde dehydrogenase (NAD+)